MLNSKAYERFEKHTSMLTIIFINYASTNTYYHQFFMCKNPDRSILPPIHQNLHINGRCNCSKCFDTPHLLSTMARVYDKISDLNPIRDNWSILVMIIRLWVVRVGNQITAIEMIFMDDKGSRIQATVRKYLAHKHERMLREGSVYAIRNFTLVDNSGTFKSDTLVPPTMYFFVDFAEVVAGVLNDTILVDVIGLMTRVGEQHDFEGGKRMKQIELDNFGHYVDERDGFLVAGDLSNVVVVIMCGKIMEFQGNRTIQNGLHCCKLMFNPTFLAAIEFKEKMLQRQNSSSQGLGRIVDISQSTLEDDFLNFNERKTLDELKENGIYADCGYIVEATIKYLTDPHAWWYNVCTRNKTVQADGLSYYCGPCGRRVVNAKPRFVYWEKDRVWTLKKKGFAIGRLRHISPRTGELYYMRILLTIQRGCTSFESIRTVNGVIHDSYQSACQALGLLTDDKEYVVGIIEASDLDSGHRLRRLFVTVLMMNTMSRAYEVWKKTWMLLVDGIIYERRRHFNLPELHIGSDELQNLCLIEIEKLLNNNGRSLASFEGFECPHISNYANFDNKIVVDELNYDKAEQAEKHLSMLNSLNQDQRAVYNQIMHFVFSDACGFFFVYGYGGTGKTFVWNTLSPALRSQGQIVLNVASSGIASLLLPGGRTTYSRFCIPIAINDLSTCSIKQGSLRAKLLQQTKLIIWDEAPMLNKHSFEALDRTLRDLLSFNDETNANKPFRGIVVVLRGDFRQILSMIQKGSRQDIISSAINSSDIWKSCTVLKLTKNMRLTTASCGDDLDETAQFADWIFMIGEGCSQSNESGEYEITIPNELLIKESLNPLQDLVDFTYPDLIMNMKNSNFFEERAILCPIVDTVQIQ
ncbi:hypothetical protein OROGR_012225 [Orobanche gracilis]